MAIRTLLFTLLTLAGLFPLTAAAPATHLLFAQMWMSANQINDPAEQDAIIVGTLFPDIRYLGTISRRETHKKGVTPKRLQQAPTPFFAGMWLHAYVDEQRVRFVKKYGVFDRLQEIDKDKRILFLKLLEDEILWDQCHLEYAQNALQDIYPEQINIGLSKPVILQWHQIMTEYFCQRPSIFLKKLAENNQGFLEADPETIAHWSKIFPHYAQDPYFIRYIQNLVTHISLTP